MGNKILIKIFFYILLSSTFSYSQQIECVDLNEMNDRAFNYQGSLGLILDWDHTSGIVTYQSTFLPPYAKQVIIMVDSSSRETSVFFHLSYHENLNKGKPDVNRLKNTIKNCMKGYVMLPLDEVEGMIGYAFHSKKDADYVHGERYWVLGLGELVYNSTDQPGRFILFLAFVQEWYH